MNAGVTAVGERTVAAVLPLLSVAVAADDDEDVAVAGVVVAEVEEEEVPLPVVVEATPPPFSPPSVVGGAADEAVAVAVVVAVLEDTWDWRNGNMKNVISGMNLLTCSVDCEYRTYSNGTYDPI